MKRAFVNEYNLNINIETVSEVGSKWRASGTIHNLNKSHSGPLKYVRSKENIVIIETAKSAVT